MIPGGSIFPVRGCCFYRHHIINISIVMVKNRKAGQRSRRCTCRNCSGTKALQSCHDSRQDKNLAGQGERELFLKNPMPEHNDDRGKYSVRTSTRERQTP